MMQDGDFLFNRKAVFEVAQVKKPIPWSNAIRHCEPIGAMMLN
jgi:hypothetical protein